MIEFRNPWYRWIFNIYQFPQISHFAELCQQHFNQSRCSGVQTGHINLTFGPRYICFTVVPLEMSEPFLKKCAQLEAIKLCDAGHDKSNCTESGLDSVANTFCLSSGTELSLPQYGQLSSSSRWCHQKNLVRKPKFFKVLISFFFQDFTWTEGKSIHPFHPHFFCTQGSCPGVKDTLLIHGGAIKETKSTHSPMDNLELPIVLTCMFWRKSGLSDALLFQSTWPWGDGAAAGSAELSSSAPRRAGCILGVCSKGRFLSWLGSTIMWSAAVIRCTGVTRGYEPFHFPHELSRSVLRVKSSTFSLAAALGQGCPLFSCGLWFSRTGLGGCCGGLLCGGVRVRLTTPGIADIVFLLDSAASDLKPWATLNCIFWVELCCCLKGAIRDFHYCLIEGNKSCYVNL